MRFAIMMCGLLAGVAALGAGWWGSPDLLVRVQQVPTIAYVGVVLAIHLLSLAAIAGGALIFFSAPASRVALLSSAVAWLFLVAVLGRGLTLPVGAIITICAAAGFAGFLPDLQTPVFQLDGTAWAGIRNEALFGRRKRPQPRAKRDGPPDIEPARRVPRAQRAGVEAAAAYRREPVFGQNDDPQGETWAFERSVNRENRRPRGKPGRSKKARSRTIAGFIVLGVVVVAIFGLLSLDPKLFSAAAVPAAPQPTGSSASASSGAVPDQAVTSSPAAMTADRLPVGAAALPGSPEPSDQPAGSDPDAIDTSDASSAPLASLPPLGSLPPIPAATPTSFATPAAYCRSVTNADAPDAKKITDDLTGLTRDARATAKMPQGDVRWRCMDGAVWTCVQPSGALACDKLPTAVDRVLICAAHPDTQGIRTAGGDWSCNGFTPVVSPSQLAAGDHRGFDKSVWRQMPDAGAPAPN